jgi:hypothetical protein
MCPRIWYRRLHVNIAMLRSRRMPHVKTCISTVHYSNSLLDHPSA